MVDKKRFFQSSCLIKKYTFFEAKLIHFVKVGNSLQLSMINLLICSQNFLLEISSEKNFSKVNP
jgi:hypothetical protein